MAGRKVFMCITECIVPVTIDGQWDHKRYRFGELIETDERPNHHFMEIKREDSNKDPRQIFESLLDDLGLKYHPDQTDRALQMIYLEHLRLTKRDDELSGLRERCKEIGAKFHPNWKEPHKYHKAIQEREIEMSVEG